MRVLNTSPRDLGFWIRSARSDSVLSRLRDQHGSEKAFDLLYQLRRDPWGVEMCRRGYQSRKYDALMRTLPERRYRRALDVGCGLGMLTRRLAARADEVLGVDLSRVAVQQAQARSRGYANVRHEQADLLALDPSLNGLFDLVLAADTLYYISPLTDDRLDRAVRRITRLLRPGGICLLANHFFFRFDPDSRTTARIHSAFRRHQPLALLSERRHAFFLAAVLEHRPPAA